MIANNIKPHQTTPEVIQAMKKMNQRSAEMVKMMQPKKLA